MLVTHYRNIGADSGEHSGVALALALLQHLVDAKWLAKDVIVLFADGAYACCLCPSAGSMSDHHSLSHPLASDGPLDGTDGFAIGTEAWLQAYHLDPLHTQDHHSVDALPMRAGVIRAALNLETRTRSWDASVMGVFAAGMNGQLPNLDLVNTAVMALRGEHIPVVLDRCTGGTQDDPFCHNDVLTRVHAWLQRTVDTVVPIEHRHDARAYVRNLHGMLRFMKTLATGPAGAHAPFVRYNIDSVTLSARESYDSAHIGATALSLRAMLRAVEKTVRALSNLEEKLHQSFFLYVLPNTHDFVSVGEYYYVVALAVSPAIAHMGVLASRTIGMRVAFSLLALLLVQVLAVGTLATAAHVLRATPALATASCVVLGVTAGQGVFVALALPLLRAQTVVSGCAERRDWRVRVRTYEEKHRDDDKKRAAESEGATPAPLAPPRPLRDILASIPQQDSGWRGIKFVVMILLVYVCYGCVHWTVSDGQNPTHSLQTLVTARYAHCILGIINYPIAFFCAVPMALFALVEPRGVKQSALKQLWCALWLLVSSPLVLFALGVALDRDGASGRVYRTRAIASRSCFLTYSHTHLWLCQASLGRSRMWPRALRSARTSSRCRTSAACTSQCTRSRSASGSSRSQRRRTTTLL